MCGQHPKHKTLLSYPSILNLQRPGDGWIIPETGNIKRFYWTLSTLFALKIHLSISMEMNDNRYTFDDWSLPQNNQDVQPLESVSWCKQELFCVGEPGRAALRVALHLHLLLLLVLCSVLQQGVCTVHIALFSKSSRIKMSSTVQTGHPV